MLCRKFRVIASSLLVLCLATPAQSQTPYPTKVVKIMVPYPAGGLLDGVARTLAPKLQEALGQPFIVENRGGASGIIGSDLVAKSKADGYTLLLGGFGPNAVNASILASVPYNAATDFAPIIEIFRTPNILVASSRLNVASVRELTELARKSPGEMTFAHAGTGSATHLFAELYRLAVDVDLNQIPYRGDAPAIAAMLGGEVHLYFASAMTILPFVKSGRLRALAVTGKQRIAALPDVPTLAEAGVPNYEATAWYGLYAPAGTPQDVISKLNMQIDKILKQPETRNALAGSGGGIEIIGGSPDVLRDHTQAEIVRWRVVVKSANIKVE